jgi:hypothetical protein
MCVSDVFSGKKVIIFVIMWVGVDGWEFNIVVLGERQRVNSTFVGNNKERAGACKGSRKVGSERKGEK